MQPENSLSEWDQKVIEKYGWCHFLQSAIWAKVKSQTSWEVLLKEASEYPLAISSRNAIGLGKIHYIPKIAEISPAEAEAFTKSLLREVKSGVALKIEFDQQYQEELDKSLKKEGWRATGTVQYDHTVLIDLSRGEEEVRSSFKKRARWEMNAAVRRGVTVTKEECNRDNMQKFFKLLQITSRRGNFKIRDQQFMESYWEKFSEAGQGNLYFARHEGDVLSAGFVITVGNRAFYKDGASIRDKANLFASRLMQWEIMKDLMSQGVETYDLCGVIVGEHSDSRNRGIYTFKTAFGEPIKLQGGYIRPLNKTAYKIWQKAEPKYSKLYIKLKKQIWY